MYLPIPTQPTCATAWLEALATVDAKPGHEAYNVMVDVAEPLAQTAADAGVIEIADKFLRGRGAMPLQSVANTIFPQGLYERHGAPTL